MSNLIELQDQQRKLKVKIRPDLTADEATSMQLECIAFASELTWPIYQARLSEARKGATARHEYTKAFQLSNGGSDRKKDADAKANEEVRLAETVAYQAECERKLLEDMKQDFRELHHSLKAMLKDKTAERLWGA